MLGLLRPCDRINGVDVGARQACSHQGALEGPVDRPQQVSGLRCLRCLAGAFSHIAGTGSRVEDRGSRALLRSRMDSGSPDRQDCASCLPGLAPPVPACCLCSCRAPKYCLCQGWVMAALTGVNAPVA